MGDEIRICHIYLKAVSLPSSPDISIVLCNVAQSPTNFTVVTTFGSSAKRTRECPRHVFAKKQEVKRSWVRAPRHPTHHMCCKIQKMCSKRCSDATFDHEVLEKLFYYKTLIVNSNTTNNKIDGTRSKESVFMGLSKNYFKRCQNMN